MKERILCVDDDAEILEILRKGLTPRFDVDTALRGEEGLDLIRNSNSAYAVIFTDMVMPEMNGVEFLSEARKLTPDSIPMLLTGYVDVETATEAVNKGHVYRFLTKPYPIEELESVVEDGLRRRQAVLAERELLAKTLGGSIQLMTEVLSSLDSRAFGRSMHLRKIVGDLARDLNIADSWEMEIAAMLQRIGVVTLPPELILKMHTNEALIPEEKKAVERVPEIGYNLLKDIPRLGNVAKIILYQDKRYDGSGFPADDVAGKNIPTGARLLKIMNDWERSKRDGLASGRAVAYMSKQSEWYDPDMMKTIQKRYGESTVPQKWARQTAPRPRKSVETHVNKLKVGDILAGSLVSTDGVLLVSTGTNITQTLLYKIRNYIAFGTLKGRILIEK